MSTTTDKLALFKYDPSTDGAQTFNIKKALNDNWDKLDDAVKEILITLAKKLGGVESTDYPGCYYRMVDGVVEWFNPPMLLGVEYRTTERYLGKPVYVKAVNFGSMPNAGTKSVNHGIANIDQCISSTGTNEITDVGNWSIPYVGSGTEAGIINCCSFSRTWVRVWSKGDDSSSTARITLKYTKTTD